ncbi:MAG: IPT/TIG domain-containing protein [Deltaproteobacteria bacterium]|nr:IPT/TIG domain-containing protein [Deltaproteobacteria bacterium]
MYHGYKVLLAGAVCALAFSFPIETRAALGQSTTVRQDSYCYKINGAGMKIFVDRKAAGAICQPPPQLDGILPDVGPLSGGQWFYVWGLHFKEGAEVLFNGTPCIHPIDYYLDSQYGWGNDYITCFTPPGKAAGSVDVVVQNPSGVKSNAVTYTYFEPQVVISISPTSGPSSGETEVIVTGRGFGEWTYPYPYFYSSSTGAYASCDNMTLIDSEHFKCTTSQVYGSACGGEMKMDFYTYDMRGDWFQNVLYGAYTFISPKLFAGSGTAADPFLVGTRADLFNVRYCPTMTYRQTADIDTGGAGGVCDPFEPTPWFSGTYDGMGRSIQNFCFEDSGRSAVGLFAYNYGALSNLVLENTNVLGRQYVAGLAGYSSGRITNVTITGEIRVSAVPYLSTCWYWDGTKYVQYPCWRGGTDAGALAGRVSGSVSNVSASKVSVSGSGNLGGVIGSAYYYPISQVSVSGTVTGTGGGLGGLVGGSSSANVDQGKASVDVTSTGWSGGIGGLVGGTSGQITNSQATGTVRGGYCVGGLVGSTENSVQNSFATGAVAGGVNVGGLAGCFWDQGRWYKPVISRSSSSGKVDGSYGASIGGLVGAMESSGNNPGATIEESFTTSDVTAFGSLYYGGLVGGGNFWGWGCAIGTIRRSFALGNVNSTWYYNVGGLVGCSCATIQDSYYAIGSIAGGAPVGGIVGVNHTCGSNVGTITNSFSAAAGLTGGGWVENCHTVIPPRGAVGETECGGWIEADPNRIKGAIKGAYFWDNGAVPGDLLATGLNSSQMQDPLSFAGYDFVNTWTMPAGGGFPILKWQTLQK